MRGSVSSCFWDVSCFTQAEPFCHLSPSSAFLPFSAPHSQHAAVHTMDFHINRWCLFSLISFCTLVGQNEGITRTFFIGIREENWDYAPGGYNHITGKPFTQDEWVSIFCNFFAVFYYYIKLGSIYQYYIIISHSTT